MIYWLTGHSGAGKSTLANEIALEMDAIILDGDEMRESISLGAGFQAPERRLHNLRVARLAKTLSKQRNIIVSVIAPMQDVRDEITEICDPQWIYIKRTMPERAGHFYEEPESYDLMLDHDLLDARESGRKFIEKFKEKPDYALFIGRWQSPYPHEGHMALFDVVRKEGKKILIAVRDTDLDEKNPYTLKERIDMMKYHVKDAKVIPLEDINSVCYGRGVGYDVRHIDLDDDLKAISATEIRKRMVK